MSFRSFGMSHFKERENKIYENIDGKRGGFVAVKYSRI